MSKQNAKEEILFLNTPIVETSQDIIGIETQVKKLDYAINAGAQMIAITAPFGSGKTSIIELFEKERNKIERKECAVAEAVDEKKTLRTRLARWIEKKKRSREDKKQRKEWEKRTKKEKLMKVSMWSQLQEETNGGSTNDLHRSFIYQFASQIDHKRGTYIRRRLNPNYGILKIHVNKSRYWVAFMMAIIVWGICWLLNTFSEEVVEIIPSLEGFESTIKIILILAGVVLTLIVLTTAEIVFSSFKSNNEKREVESSEIIDLYREEILKYAWKVGPVHSGSKKYIVVIEDLDRTSDAEAVIRFLKELRKYYIPQKAEEKSRYQNQVIFIVNVKPESFLVQEADNGDGPQESLYAKLFDYVLNLQTINIDNFDSILDGLLQEKEGLINRLGIEKGEKLSDVSGMKWIIRERRLGIREIKERLNIAFSLYESLKGKFPEKPIAFEKCAVVAYLTTAFEEDFYHTEDRAFQELVNLSIQGKLTDGLCEKYLESTSGEYVRTVRELIEARLIDSTYRTYFYNYPKGSFLYSLEEMQIMDAILYADKIDNIDQAAEAVTQMDSEVFQRAFQTLEQLQLPLKHTVFESEILYINALKYVREKVFQYIESLDYSENADARNIRFILRILSYDRTREKYTKKDAERMCAIWEQHFSETAILQLRFMLCKEFSSEITWYKDLFFDVHAVIREEEMELLSLVDSIALVNYEHEDFDISLPDYLQKRFAAWERVDAEEEKQMEAMLRMSGDCLPEQEMANLYLDYMNTVGRIVSDFEAAVYEILDDKATAKEDKEELLNKYQQIVNTAADRLTAATLDKISSLEPREGYNSEVAKKFLEEEYYLDYVLTLLFLGERIPFETEAVKEGLKINLSWLKENIAYFLKIREKLCECPEEILSEYMFLFTGQYPALTEKELKLIQDKNENGEEMVMQLLPCELVAEDNYEMLAECFNRKKQTNNMSFEILMYISGLSSEIARELFYSLDFEMVRYRFISSSRKSEVKRKFAEILDLDEPKEKLRFMRATRCIDTAWEAKLVDTLKVDEDLRDYYIEVVNSLDTVSKGTINTLCRLGKIYPMSPLVNSLFYENKKYVEFVVSETTGKKYFEMAEGDKRSELWPSYLKIFSGKGYPNTRKYMSENADFVRMVMHEKSYTDFYSENRMQMTGVFQDSESIKDVMEYGEAFALDFYSEMAGFEDEEAAAAFVAIVEKSDELLASDELYAHTHEKLVNGPLKAKYTNARKKRGYGK